MKKQNKKQNVVAVIFPVGLESQKEKIQEFADAAGMTASKYVLILIQRHINEGKPLRVV